MRHRSWLALALLAAGLPACGPAPSDAAAQFSVIAVDRPGCGSGDFRLAVMRSGLAGGQYVVRTQVTVGNLVYMDERASIFLNGSSDWKLWEDFSYAPSPQRGWFPLPAGQLMRIDFTLRRPVGDDLAHETIIVDGCDSGRIVYRRPVFSDGFGG